METITVDHCVLVKLIDKDKSERQRLMAQASAELLDYCLANEIQIFMSSRVENWDAATMTDQADHDRLAVLVTKYKIKETSAGFRLGDLPVAQTGKSSLIGPRGTIFGGIDMLVDHPSACPKTQAFISVFGEDPIDRPASNTGRKLPNWIGDYDSLKGHYIAGYGIFVTLDTNVPCFDASSRERAFVELDLLIKSPEEALYLLRTRA